LDGQQEGHPACKKMGDGGGGQFSSGTGSPGWSWRKGRKTVVMVVVELVM